jgi:hypothetical protein
MDILAHVRGSPSITLSAIGEEMRRFPLVFRMIRQIDRVAIVADEHSVRVASRIEGALIPGVHYEVYGREHAVYARVSLLHQTDDPRPRWHSSGFPEPVERRTAFLGFPDKCERAG